MDQVPPEIMREIFQFLFDHRSTWLSLKLVCKTWFHISLQVLDPSVNDNEAIRWACKEGNADCVQSLLNDPRVSLSTRDNKPLRSACKHGWEKIVHLLLDRQDSIATIANNKVFDLKDIEHPNIIRMLVKDPRFDPSINQDFLIGLAAKKGDVELITLLLQDPRVDPSNRANLALRLACSQGHLEIVKLLLADPRVDPTSAANSALFCASVNGHLDIELELMRDPRLGQSNLTVFRASICGNA
eukprot:TRINITY_DN6871_c0_g1_i1.p1 TRINITY_DN6871_c0_g1~~TRINITY_DN6871_c0_g1_i1.p1  ORF type:complete len:243 (+),score=47.17 TRINITY_DN6871_c0_g1_i1:55-783(+)